MEASNGETRFREVPEVVTAVMRFPKARLATFTCGFGEAGVAEYRVVGTTGDLYMNPAYGFDTELKLELTVQGKSTETRYKKRDQVGAEIAYFADCVLNNRDPEPDGYEGLADVLIIDAIAPLGPGREDDPARPVPGKAPPVGRPGIPLPAGEPPRVGERGPAGRGMTNAPPMPHQ